MIQVLSLLIGGIFIGVIAAILWFCWYLMKDGGIWR